jgi:hypothetical protein
MSSSKTGFPSIYDVTGETFAPITFAATDPSVLLCPHCGGENLAHDEVRLYNRDEDAATVRWTLADASRVNTSLISNDESGNPSARRHGLAIRFRCEACGRAHKLTIAQHKGSTLCAWH